jgi:hypothetical protein
MIGQCERIPLTVLRLSSLLAKRSSLDSVSGQDSTTCWKKMEGSFADVSSLSSTTLPDIAISLSNLETRINRIRSTRISIHRKSSSSRSHLIILPPSPCPRRTDCTRRAASSDTSVESATRGPTSRSSPSRASTQRRTPGPTSAR